MSYHKSVKCDVCEKLHEYESNTYITIRGTILVGENKLMFESNELSKDRAPTIHLCPTCLIEKIRLNFPPKVSTRGHEL